MANIYTIYHNGKYRIVPHVTAFVVVGENGQVLDRYRADEIELAIETVDAMAQTDANAVAA